MPEAQAEPTPTETAHPVPSEPTPTPVEGKTFTQEQVNSLLADQKRTVQAKYVDYDTLKTAAQKLADIEDSQKTELQKAADRASAAESTAAEKAAALLRYEVAADKKLTGDDLAFLTATTKEGLEKQADLVLAKNAAAAGVKPAPPAPDPSIGPKDPPKPTGLGGAIKAHYESN